MGILCFLSAIFINIFSGELSPYSIALDGLDFSNKSYTRKFKKELPKKYEKFSYILYGNPQYGYFKTTEFKLVESAETLFVEFEFVPPGHKYVIEFYTVDQLENRRLIEEATFRSSVPPIFNFFKAKVDGNLTKPFYTLNLTLGGEGGNRPYFIPIIINRKGEIVHTYISNFQKKRADYFISKKVEGNVYAHLMTDEEEPYLEVVSLNGELFNRVRASDFSPKLIMNHEFYLDFKKGILWVLGKEIFYTRPFQRYLSRFFDNPLKVILSAFFAPDRFLGSTIEKVDIRKMERVNIWKSSNHLNPNQYTGEKLDKLDAVNVFSRRQKASYKTDRENSPYNWSHASSFAKSDEGFLLLHRNLGQVLKVSNDLNNTQWILGPHESSTYRLVGRNKLGRPHHVRSHGKNRFFLVDNLGPLWNEKRGTSRVLEFELSETSGNIIWEYEIPFIGRRGSVDKIDNEKLLLFIPRWTKERYRQKKRTFSEIREIDYKSRQVLGSMKLNLHEREDSFQMTYRAESLDSLGKEEFITYEL
jgi:hypothetical protein